MQIEAIGTAARRADLIPGDCFFFHDGKQSAFAIWSKEEEGGHTAAIVFSREGGDRLPWAATAGLPHTILLTRPLLLRSDPTSVTFGNEVPLGNLITAGGSFYLAAALGRIDVVTINIVTGMTENIPNTGSFVSFSRWAAGIVEGERWIPVFEFPLSPPR
ncbi:hypothetical protein IVA79_08085 [Bradyrhizobium sp. 138]|uniref:hypothetical protein n=1 Tax=Bradyrhizobium sp. 138 TaxID=2782615 RepID=UPI001FF7AD27|nr:hypothetical protein [Bradyrhizobium sp. 138]MCK1733914.1 hypothetical protein [Bradyrhizobium sp. 138]